jgi:hypothetical protein
MMANLNEDFWDRSVIPMPTGFREAANEAARSRNMMGTEYCRQALLRALDADGVKLNQQRHAHRKRK